jgi:hypothetical protein
VLLRNDGSAAVQGEAGFPALLQQLPDRLLHAPSKRDLTRSMTTAAAAGGYIFPWQAVSFMLYGALGVHDNGFNSIESGMVAVDMLSDGDEAAGHAPNRLLAAAAGTITYKCYDGTSTAVHVVGTASDFFYSHLSNNANLSVGNAFQQGQELGQMVPGTFSGNCGWTSQADNWFHVHWGFPNADLQVENWTLSLATGNWRDG